MQTENSIVYLNNNLIIPNKYQPRKIFDDASIENLATSIKTYGIINPILVRKKDDKYEIIAGERRFRAAQKIGLNEVPVIIKNADEQQMAELALIENIQRQGLSPIEEAKSYEEIMRIGNQTQQSLANKLGKSQSTIANKIRLLSLPVEIQDALANKEISERHARSLISIKEKEQQIELLNRIIREKLTVKETDEIINAKETDEEEIKQAISDIMKSLNIKEDEKEDDNMNNGNFFPNFDNNSINNNASLNMMNMQSMNQTPLTLEPETVMPTVNQPVMEPQFVQTPEPAVSTQFEQPTMMNNIFNPMAEFVTPQEPTITTPLESVMQNEQPMFTPSFVQPTTNIEVQPQMNVSPQMIDTPLFNPNVVMPQQDTSFLTNMVQEPQILETPIMNQNSFEVPVLGDSINEPVNMVEDKLSILTEFLNANNYTYKSYNNETTECIIIEMPKNNQ